jgi:biopolymer transport protein ExbB/TolQ
MIMWFFIAIAGWTVAAVLFAMCVAFFALDVAARHEKRRIAEERDALAKDLSHARDALASYKTACEELQRIRGYSLRRLAEVEQARGKSYRVEVVNLDDESEQSQDHGNDLS